MRLFSVEYTDGSTYKQDKKDVSVTDPKRSAYYDVLHSGKEIKTFAIGPLQVNLLDGTFTVNGLTIQVEENPLPVKRELVFFRQHQHDFSTNYKADKGILKLLNGKETDHRITYFIGWKLKGEKDQHILGVK